MRRLTVKRIVEIVAAHADVTVAALCGDRKTDDVVVPRHRAFCVIRRLRPDMSYPEIGRRMGGKDHTTVLHGERRALERAQQPEEAAQLAELMALCRAEASTLEDLAAEMRAADPHAGLNDEELLRHRRVDRIDRAIYLVGGVLAELQQVRELVSDTTGDLFEELVA